MICSNKSSGLKTPRRHMQARPISEVAGRRSPVAFPSLARRGNCPISANLGGLCLPHWGAKYPCPWRFPAKRVRITCNHQTLGSSLTNVRYFTSQHLLYFADIHFASPAGNEGQFAIVGNESAHHCCMLSGRISLRQSLPRMSGLRRLSSTCQLVIVGHLQALRLDRRAPSH